MRAPPQCDDLYQGVVANLWTSSRPSAPSETLQKRRAASALKECIRRTGRVTESGDPGFFAEKRQQTREVCRLPGTRIIRCAPPFEHVHHLAQ